MPKFTCKTSIFSSVYTVGKAYSLIEDQEFGTLIESNSGPEMGVRWNEETKSAVTADGEVVATFE